VRRPGIGTAIRAKFKGLSPPSIRWDAAQRKRKKWNASEPGQSSPLPTVVLTRILARSAMPPRLRSRPIPHFIEPCLPRRAAPRRGAAAVPGARGGQPRRRRRELREHDRKRRRATSFLEIGVERAESSGPAVAGRAPKSPGWTTTPARPSACEFGGTSEPVPYWFGRSTIPVALSSGASRRPIPQRHASRNLTVWTPVAALRADPSARRALRVPMAKLGRRLQAGESCPGVSAAPHPAPHRRLTQRSRSGPPRRSMGLN
jgi:hypothetical protein